MIKSTKDDMRANGLVLMEQVARKSASPAVFQQLVTFFADTLAGKNGILAQWYMRFGVVRVLRLLVAAVHHNERELSDELGNAAVPTLSAFVHNERSEAGRGGKE